jgi:ferredoxin
MMYHVYVDQSRCQGHARCYAAAPEVFDFDDEGYSHVPEDKSRHAELPADVRHAVASCPERAIFVEEEQST